MCMIMMWNSVNMNTTTIIPRWKVWMLILANIRMLTKKRMRTTSKTFCESQRNHRTNNPVHSTGGLIPCPAAITVLLLCIQCEGIYARCRAGTVFQHRFSDHAGFSGRSGGFQRSSGNQTLEWLDTLARRAPYFSSVLIALVGIYMGYHGWIGVTS